MASPVELEPDYVTVPGQNFCVISFVGPDMPQRCDQVGFKIRGCFATKDEAASHAKRLQKDDATFDIWVMDMYRWCLPPSKEVMENVDTHYADDRLEELISSYKENQAQAARMFEERKRDMSKKADGNYLKASDENSVYYTKEDEAPIRHPSEVIEELKKTRGEDTPMEDLIKEADEIIKAEIEERRIAREKKEAEAEAKAEPEAKAEE